MKRTAIALIATLCAITAFAQSFEGKIVYKNTFKSKIPNLSDEKLTMLLGSDQEYFIKNGDYKSTTNSTLSQWLLYVNKDNKLYSKRANSDTLYWIDGATKPEQLLKSELNKGVTEILGYTCDELILTFASGVQKYYFNPGIASDASLFINHIFGNWYDYLSKTNSLPLKSIVENEHFILENVATEITEMKFEKTFFDLPQDSKILRSQY